MDDSPRTGESSESQVQGERAAHLAALAAAGDADAFEALVVAYQRRVYGFACRYLRDEHEAADLAQEIFLRLFRKLDRFDPARPFEPWLWRLAARVSSDYRERLAPTRRAVSLDCAHPASLRAPDTARREETALGSALRRLPRSYRLPLLLHHELDVGLADIAEATHSTVPAVKSRLHRARLELQRELLRDAPDPLRGPWPAPSVSRGRPPPPPRGPRARSGSEAPASARTSGTPAPPGGRPGSSSAGA